MPMIVALNASRKAFMIFGFLDFKILGITGSSLRLA